MKWHGATWHIICGMIWPLHIIWQCDNMTIWMKRHGATWHVTCGMIWPLHIIWQCDNMTIWYLHDMTCHTTTKYNQRFRYHATVLPSVLVSTYNVARLFPVLGSQSLTGCCVSLLPEAISAFWGCQSTHFTSAPCPKIKKKSLNLAYFPINN